MRYLIINVSMLLATPLGASYGNFSSLLDTSVRQAAYRHGLESELLIAIYRVESGLQLGAVNAHTHDYGIAQINKHTIRAYGFDKQRLLQDLEYSVNAGALVLADFKRQYVEREPITWPCRYNLGSKPIIGRRAELCVAYLNKLKRSMVGR